MKKLTLKYIGFFMLLLALFVGSLDTEKARADLTLWYLDGTTLKPVDPSWSIGVSGSAGGTHGTIQFNNGGAFSGTGSLTFSTTSNTLTVANLHATSSLLLPVGATASTTVFGYLAGDNNAWAASRGALQIFDGTANTLLLGALSSDSPANGEVPKWNTGGTITWEADNTASLSGGSAGQLTYWATDSTVGATATPYMTGFVSTSSTFANTFPQLSFTNATGTSITTLGSSTIQTLNSTTIVTGTLNTGQGANELFDMDQNVQTTDAVVFSTVDTGQGVNELYDMNQNVLTSSDVVFNSILALASSTLQTFQSTTATIASAVVNTLDVFATGVRLTATDGILTLLGLGNGNDENLTIDLDNAAANNVAIGSGTGVTGITFGTIGISANASSTFANLNVGTSTFTGATNFTGSMATTTFRGPIDANGAQVAQGWASSTASSPQTINWLSGNTQSYTLSGTVAFELTSTSSHPQDGGRYTLRFCQDTSGSRSQTWTSGSGINLRWWNGTTTISSAANSCTYLFMMFDSSSSKYHVVASSTGLQLR